MVVGADATSHCVLSFVLSKKKKMGRFAVLRPLTSVLVICKCVTDMVVGADVCSYCGLGLVVQGIVIGIYFRDVN